MKERPILFSSEMVRAILEGRKTQTRRVIKPQFTSLYGHGMKLGDDRFSCHVNITKTDGSCAWLYCPYGMVGGQLWVRETWGVYDRITTCADDLPNYQDKAGIHHPVVHFAGKENYAWGMYGPPRKRSGRFMPKSAARLWLVVENIRVQQLQDITRDDAKAEGVSSVWVWTPDRDPKYFNRGVLNPYGANYSVLWDTINSDVGKRWDDNPWVWVVEFSRKASADGSIHD